MMKLLTAALVILTLGCGTRVIERIVEVPVERVVEVPVPPKTEAIKVRAGMSISELINAKGAPLRVLPLVKTKEVAFVYSDITVVIDYNTVYEVVEVTSDDLFIPIEKLSMQWIEIPKGTAEHSMFGKMRLTVNYPNL